MSHAQEVSDLREHVLCELQNRMMEPVSPEMATPETAHLGPRITETQPPSLRLSHGLDCIRRLFYAHTQDRVSDPSPAWVQLTKFSIGDLWEAFTHSLLPLCAPPGWVYEDCDDDEVEIEGIRGHLDGAFINEEKKLIVISDTKFTSPYRYKDWDDSLPENAWGQLYQGGNYIAALAGDPEMEPGWEVIGFVWPTLIPTPAGPWKFDVGYATASELEPWGAKARRQYRDVQRMSQPPERLAEHPGGKCRYCEFRTLCAK